MTTLRSPEGGRCQMHEEGAVGMQILLGDLEATVTALCELVEAAGCQGLDRHPALRRACRVLEGLGGETGAVRMDEVLGHGRDHGPKEIPACMS